MKSRPAHRNYMNICTYIVNNNIQLIYKYEKIYFVSPIIEWIIVVNIRYHKFYIAIN